MIRGQPGCSLRVHITLVIARLGHIMDCKASFSRSFSSIPSSITPIKFKASVWYPGKLVAPCETLRIMTIKDQMWRSLICQRGSFELHQSHKTSYIQGLQKNEQERLVPLTVMRCLFSIRTVSQH